MKVILNAMLGLWILFPTAARGAEIPRQWEVFETSFASARVYSNAFTEVEVDVVFKQGERQWKVPAFWSGGNKWTVRFAPPTQGEYTYRIECTDQANPGLNGKEQTLTVGAYKGDNRLLKHGFLRVSPDNRHFEHADGTPFFWLGDTWWKGLCKRLTWEGFQEHDHRRDLDFHADFVQGARLDMARRARHRLPGKPSAAARVTRRWWISRAWLGPVGLCTTAIVFLLPG